MDFVFQRFFFFFFIIFALFIMFVLQITKNLKIPLFLIYENILILVGSQAWDNGVLWSVCILNGFWVGPTRYIDWARDNWVWACLSGFDLLKNRSGGWGMGWDGMGDSWEFPLHPSLRLFYAFVIRGDYVLVDVFVGVYLLGQ